MRERYCAVALPRNLLDGRTSLGENITSLAKVQSPNLLSWEAVMCSAAEMPRTLAIRLLFRLTQTPTKLMLPRC
jgi:hypothetical protein